MNIPVKYKCICGEDELDWLDFTNKSFSLTQVFYKTCLHKDTPKTVLSKTFVILVKDPCFRAHSIIGLPEDAA